MKHCKSAGVHWHIALLEFLCTPSPDGHSPSELLGRQFCGILPMIDTNTVNSDKFAARKDKEKEKFDNKHPRELKPLLVGSTVSYLNSDLKTWSVGVVILHSPDNRSYHVKTENDQVISRNWVHLRETNVEFVLQVQNILKVSNVLKVEKMVNQFQTQMSPQSLKWSLQINVALLVLMLVLTIIVTKQDLAMKSENHLGISKS